MTPHLSKVETEILRLLIANGEMYGLQLVGASRLLKRGTIYVTMERMSGKGLVTSRALKDEHGPGMPRRLFSTTALGQRMYQAQQTVDAIWIEAKQPRKGTKR